MNMRTNGERDAKYKYIGFGNLPSRFLAEAGKDMVIKRYSKNIKGVSEEQVKQ